MLISLGSASFSFCQLYSSVFFYVVRISVTLDVTINSAQFRERLYQQQIFRRQAEMHLGKIPRITA